MEYCQNVRATQSKKDGNGMRYNPIEDLVKVKYSFNLYDKIIDFVGSWSQLHIVDDYKDYIFRYKVII